MTALGASNLPSESRPGGLDRTKKKIALDDCFRCFSFDQPEACPKFQTLDGIAHVVTTENELDHIKGVILMQAGASVLIFR
jgi:hypothetical protein